MVLMQESTIEKESDSSFLKVVCRHFSPYVSSSGTESMAPLLYSLVRMVRPRTIVEYGSGYSTVWLLKALSENQHSFQQEKMELLLKCREFSDLATKISELSTNTHEWPEDIILRAQEWFFKTGKACTLDPEFYRTSDTCKLYSFEDLPFDHDYPRKVREAVEDAREKARFVQVCGHQEVSAELLFSNGFQKNQLIDLAWNDHTNYIKFYNEFWPLLNPAGGLMIFHNVTGFRENLEPILQIKKMHLELGDLELIVLEEPHKLNQNSCAILRKTSAFQPRFFAENGHRVICSMKEFLKNNEAEL